MSRPETPQVQPSRLDDDVTAHIMLAPEEPVLPHTGVDPASVHDKPASPEGVPGH